jgi:UDP-GlcNAc:undecaprenyl-phosphate/decaprenyl-phosphate GlcNAc-1-phosphate transferase
MYILLLLGTASFALALALTPLCRDLFLRLRLVDLPDGERKLHKVAVPRVGGMAVAISYAVPLAVFSMLSFRLTGLLMAGLPFRWEFPLAGVVIFATGLLDDIRGLAPWQKLTGQFAGAALACCGGVRIAEIHGSPLGLWLSVPVTLVWLVGCTNAFNLIDGIDGLAAGVGIFATLTITLAAILQRNTAVIYVTVPLAASLLGFLRYNFNPASIFLGDSGSMLVGFLLGCYGVLWSEKSATILGMMAPITALALPLLDTALAVTRRIIRGRPIFSADRGHIHHRLLDRGLTPRRAVFLLYGFCALAAALSLLQSTREQLAGPIIVLFCAGFWVGVQRLGYVEFGALGRLLADATSLRTLHARIHLTEFRNALAAAKTPDECWRAVLHHHKKFGVSEVTLKLGGVTYSNARPKPNDAGDSWTVVIPLSPVDSASLSRDGTEPRSFAMAAFSDVLAAALKKKIPLFQPAGTAAPGKGHSPDLGIAEVVS